MTRDRSEEQIIIIVAILYMLSDHIGDFGYNHYHHIQVLKIEAFTWL